MTSQHNESILNLLFWNSRGIRNKFVELSDYIVSECLDIVGVNETFLDGTVNLPQIKNYDVVRVDKSNSSGGLLLIVKDCGMK